ncbi:hypothetical protein ACLVWU_11065 [Bdellovibrio sp. HCB290]|uniref:hypothetical protein n=1 Tax=Bdellovibrio sp. HCB290 TaxID=3394356 RepID=UPI0039B4AA69
MKKHVVVLLALLAVGCAQKPVVKEPEIVASCFADGDKQDMCKAERTNEKNEIVITRCIGQTNRNALASLRGKCVERICTKGSNNDCQVRGEIAVLDQYSELVRAKHFAEEEDDAAPAPKKIAKFKKKKGKGAIKAEAQELDVDPMAELPKMPEKPEPVVKKAPPKAVSQEPAEPAPINVTLKADSGPTKGASSPKPRKPASTVAAADGFKKVCVAKTDQNAPETLRGKCATRNCSDGKCTFGGRKEMFDYVARSGT